MAISSTTNAPSQFQEILATTTLIAALALVVFTVALASGAFGHQSKYFIMAGCFAMGSIPLFVYSALHLGQGDTRRQPLTS